MKSHMEYPKSRRKAKHKQIRSERTGDSYHYHPTMGDSDEVQFQRRVSWYGKKAPPQREDHGGMYVSPLRTMISS